jgi:hypothetical protein
MRACIVLEPTRREVVLATVSVWIALMLSRVFFYGLERFRYPDIVPPVWVHVIQGVALGPCILAGSYLTLRTWRYSGAAPAVAVAIATSLVVGVLAGLIYVLGALLNPGEVSLRAWLGAARPTGAHAWYGWLSVIVEFNTLYLSCLAAVGGFFSFRKLMHERRARLRADAEAARNRQRVLRAQLNPHFLFNALNSIASLNDTQPQVSQRLVVQLSDLLRHTLAASECEQHRLSDELAYVEKYLHIQQVRLPSRLRWRIRADPHCSAAQVPSLILLPLVENAVVHGPRGGMHIVEIDIDVTCPDSQLVMSVTNTSQASPIVQDAHTGLGLRNVRERLEISYGGEAKLVTQFTTEGRFQAVIHLPAARPVESPEPWEPQCES